MTTLPDQSAPPVPDGILADFRVDVDQDRNPDPYLICARCEQMVCTVEHDDSLLVLAHTARGHAETCAGPPKLLPVTNDELHVLLDCLPQAKFTGGYDSDPADDPKASPEGWGSLQEALIRRAEELLGRRP